MQWQPAPPRPPAAIRPLGLGEIIDGGFRILKRNLGALVKISAIFVVPIQVVTVLTNLSVLPQRRTVSFGTFSETTYVQQHSALTLSVVLLFTALLGMSLRLLAAGATARLVSQEYLGHHTDAAASLRYALQRLGALIGASLLTLLGMGLGFLACILPGIFLAVAWSVTTPALIVEGVSAPRAMGRSMELVRPRWWPVLGYEIVIFLLVTVPTIIIAIPVAIIANRNTAGGVILSGVANGIVQLFTTPFAAATIVLLYVDLRVRKEGFDIAVMAQSLDASGRNQPAGPSGPPGAAAPPKPSAPPPAPTDSSRPTAWGSPPPNEWGAPPPPPHP